MLILFFRKLFLMSHSVNFCPWSLCVCEVNLDAVSDFPQRLPVFIVWLVWINKGFGSFFEWIQTLIAVNQDHRVINTHHLLGIYVCIYIYIWNWCPWQVLIDECVCPVVLHILSFSVYVCGCVLVPGRHLDPEYVHLWCPNDYGRDALHCLHFESMCN